MKIKNPNTLIFEQDFVSLRDFHHVLCRDESNHGKHTREQDAYKEAMPMCESLLADDYSEIMADDGFRDRETVLKTFDRNGLQEYSLGPIKTANVHPGVVLLTYEFHVKEMHGRVVEEDFLGSSLWSNRSGRLVNVFFQETPKP